MVDVAFTGMSKTPSNGRFYWEGFHLPTADEMPVAEEVAA